MQYPPQLLRDYCERLVSRDVARSIEIAAGFDPELAVAIANERARRRIRANAVPLNKVAEVAGYAF